MNQGKISKEDWKLDDSGRTPAFFALKKQVGVSQEMINELKIISDENNKATVRFCLNSSPDEEMQDMVIFEYKDNKCRIPHKHTDSNEAIHLIKGKILILVFDDKGELVDKRVLSEQGEVAYRNAINMQHLYFPLSEYAVFREIRCGKFVRENNVSADFDLKETLGEYLGEDLMCHNKNCKAPCELLSD